jgi:solute carrier family 25 protein 44
MDHGKFLVYGVGMFSGIITALFPLSVIKIRQMSSTDFNPGISGARDTARQILKQEGSRGLYRGYGTVLAGAIPVRPPCPHQRIWIATYSALSTDSQFRG